MSTFQFFNDKIDQNTNFANEADLWTPFEVVLQFNGNEEARE